ncbi:rnhA, partial [Mucuna pruriens]
MALSEYDIIYVNCNVIKGSALDEHLAYHPLTEPQPLYHEFPDEHTTATAEIEPQYENEWTMWFDGASNILRNGTWVVLNSPKGQCFPFLAKLGFDCTNNMAEYEACIMGLLMALEHQAKRLKVYGDSTLLHREWGTRDVKLIPYHDHAKEIMGAFDAISFHHVPCEENQMADALATLSATVQVNEGQEITIHVRQQSRVAYCQYLGQDTSETDPEPWYFDIKRYLEKGEYLEGASENNKRTLRRLATNQQEEEQIIEEVHEGTFGTQSNGHTLARKILRAGYYWTKLESDCYQHVQKCIKCQIHADHINVTPSTLHNLTSP